MRSHRNHLWWLILPLSIGAVGCLALASCRAEATPPSVHRSTAPVQVTLGETYTLGKQTLAIEFLDDDLVHFEFSSSERTPGSSGPLEISPMVAKTDYPGPSVLTRPTEGVLETGEMRVEVDLATLCLKASDLSRAPALILTEICPYQLEEDFKGVTLAPAGFTHAYGLGQKFINAGTPDGDWIGRSRFPGEFGNVMEEFDNGKVGNTQIPIVYFARLSDEAYALFLDSPYRQLWDFSGDPWKVLTAGERVPFYLLTGPGLQDLRGDYLELVGRPPVPPKKMFGLWVSEYGYDSWDELREKLRTLRDNGFPIDGFILDLQWFGGIEENSDNTPEGSLTWDRTSFPDPEGEIARLREKEGVGIVLIEQSYVGRNLPEHDELESKGYLVRRCETCSAVYLTQNPWWGKGGMIDWTNLEASTFWHDWKREPLIEGGVMGHWSDLGEPEIFDPRGWYAGLWLEGALRHEHEAIHNLYNLLWSQSIFEGYQRNAHTQRPFILSRSGTAGSQRYGVAMWSGDIAGSLSSLATHLNAQMHMSLSGIDYFGADIGGFWRQPVDMYEIYTQWFAYGMAFDIPGRPHTFNLGNQAETAPDRIGDLESNLANVRLRYALSPYLYSLAHRAYWYGEPIFPPLVFYFPDDPAVREMGGEKLMGRDLLVACVASPRATDWMVYLPAGKWADFHTGEWVESEGAWFGPIPLYPEGRYRLPMFARTGAIFPMMFVDELTMNVVGKRLDGSNRDELIVRVFPGAEFSEFSLYEDDGVSVAYQAGEVRTTRVTQQLAGESVLVTIESASGSYRGALERRDNLVMLMSASMGVPSMVRLNDTELLRYENPAALETGQSGWAIGENGVVIARSGIYDVLDSKRFEFVFPPASAAISLQVHP